MLASSFFATGILYSSTNDFVPAEAPAAEEAPAEEAPAAEEQAAEG